MKKNLETLASLCSLFYLAVFKYHYFQGDRRVITSYMSGTKKPKGGNNHSVSEVKEDDSGKKRKNVLPTGDVECTSVTIEDPTKKLPLTLFQQSVSAASVFL